jgi:hypothetical protein
VTYEDRTSPVSVTLDGVANDGEAGERDNVLPDVEVIVGGLVGDDLVGDAADNSVEGGRGDDLIEGARGADTLVGEDGADLVQARDGQKDDVACADGSDLAIADDHGDKLIECETVDRPSTRRVALGRYAIVRAGESYGLRLPQGHRFYPLKEELKIPIGSTIDPEAGVVRLSTARNRRGGRQVASVSAGRFTVRQQRGRRTVTTLRLAGRLPHCPRSSTRRGKAKAAAGPSRKLHVNVKHRRGRKKTRRVNYRVGGRYSIAGSYGTEWTTEDRCDGTLTTVLRGTVRVRDFGRGKTVTVRRGHRYLAAR